MASVFVKDKFNGSLFLFFHKYAKNLYIFPFN